MTTVSTVHGLENRHKPPTGVLWPLFMGWIRVPLILAGAGIVLLVYRRAGSSAGTAASVAWSPFVVNVVNLLCLGLLVWRARVEGFRLADMIGLRRSSALRDLGWGLLWSLLLYVMFALGLMTVVLAVGAARGALGSQWFIDVFVGTGDYAALSLPLWFLAGNGLLFPLLNPVVEELQYRGYAQTRLIAVSGNVALSIALVSVPFAVQHTAFAASPVGAVAFVVAFLLWSASAGVIVWRQGRLAPVIVAHAITNVATAAAPIVGVVLR